MTDTEIINLFFERSEQAITELAKKHGNAVARVARNILGNEQDYAAFVAGWDEEKLQTWNLDDVVAIRLENKKKSVVYTLEEL